MPPTPVPSARLHEAAEGAYLLSETRPVTRPLRQVARGGAVYRPIRNPYMPIPTAAMQPGVEQPPTIMPPLPPIPQGGDAPNFERCFRIVENAGFYISPFLGRLSTNLERDRARREHAANRRSVAIPEWGLFNSVVRQDNGLLGFPLLPGDPVWAGNVLLDAAQDLMLFAWLQDHYAFKGLKLNEDFRKEDGSGRIGHVRKDDEIWEILRAKGYFWDVHNERNGRWRNRAGPLYTDQEEDESDIFQELAMQGAFATAGLTRIFPARDDYFLFRNFRRMDVRWDHTRGVWSRGEHSTLFNDEVRSPQELIPMRLARRLGARVIRGESRAFAQQANTVTAAALRSL